MKKAELRKQAASLGGHLPALSQLGLRGASKRQQKENGDGHSCLHGASRMYLHTLCVEEMAADSSPMDKIGYSEIRSALGPRCDSMSFLSFQLLLFTGWAPSECNAASQVFPEKPLKVLLKGAQSLCPCSLVHIHPTFTYIPHSGFKCFINVTVE